ncbi:MULTISPECIES: BON domain-containing protein [unclassified Rhizobium]|uniref:BON domain-containing protein n=1 Tax=unclassified Rhizobium TaxID=2613769 RepID=UPI00254CBB19|nr:BON domain-containing protein [Rhizobium sp. CNPSo 4062]MDK4700652.1 BON domain-containing protein [Rhizobium sp. CNPSo 4062]
MTQFRKKKALSREEDYRDYQDRDTREGWPYSDESALGSTEPENREYGTTPANFDEDTPSGLIGDNADTNGLEEDTAHTLGPLPPSRIDNDELEAAITERFIESEEIDADSIEVHADGGIVTLEGSVETQAAAEQAEALGLSTPGVVKVRNNLKTTGVDSHIPPDA